MNTVWMMLFILGAFYATMAAAGYLTELIFGGLGLIPAGRHAKVLQASIQWDYTTVLNMMGGAPDAGHEHHAHAGH